jgi:hypothetical protein
MDERPNGRETGIDDERADALVSAIRTSLGDYLRSVIYFTPSAFDVLYVRRDLYDTVETARAAKAPLVDAERTGFAEGPVRSAATETGGSSIGPYAFTVRFHEEGFVVRILHGDAGVIVTTDEMDVGAFEETAAAVHRLLVDRDA